MIYDSAQRGVTSEKGAKYVEDYSLDHMAQVELNKFLSEQHTAGDLFYRHGYRVSSTSCSKC